ncbi:MAG: hypothetical protein IJW09_04845, partial [Clostridia bacterium]|nr:hypothetical protein [Clostridia bacterium]
MNRRDKTSQTYQIAFEKMQFGENFSSNSFSTVIGRIFSGSFYYLNSKLIGAHFPFLAGANASFDIYLPSILFYLFAIYFFVLNFKQILKNFLATPLS